jgi:hypothetical protein
MYYICIYMLTNKGLFVSLRPGVPTTHNLQTGLPETASSVMRTAGICIRSGPDYPARFILPVITVE